MKRKLIMAVFFVVLIKGLFAQGIGFNLFKSRYGIYVETGMELGMLKIGEKVYLNEESDEIISDVQWDMGKNLGISINFEIRPENIYNSFGLYFSGGLSVYFPSSGGKVIDSDYFDEGKKWSEGINVGTTLSAMESSFGFGGIIPLKKYFNKNMGIKTGIRIWYGRYIVIAHDGEIRQFAYGFELNEEDEKQKLYGTGIYYNQEWISISPEIEFRVNINSFDFGLGLNISPFISGFHIDNHYFRKDDKDDDEQKYLIFEDKIKKGKYLNINFDCRYKTKKNIDLGVLMEYKTILKGRGDTVIKTTGLVGYMYDVPNAAGGELKKFKISTFVNFKL
jgi:outer membrane protease